jgi:hypothetical protein
MRQLKMRYFRTKYKANTQRAYISYSANIYSKGIDANLETYLMTILNLLYFEP